MKWLERILRVKKHEVREATSNVEEWGAHELDDIANLDVPHGWPVVPFKLSALVDTNWLLARLHSYQSCYASPKHGQYNNAPSLAGDLFAAGFESEALAWLWGEKPQTVWTDQVTGALAEVGLGLLPIEWVLCLDIRQTCLDVLAGTISHDQGNTRLYSRMYDYDYKVFVYWIYDWEALLNRGTAAEVKEHVENIVQKTETIIDLYKGRIHEHLLELTSP